MSAITEPQHAALTRMLAERVIPTGLMVGTKPVSIDSLDGLTVEEASRVIRFVKDQPLNKAGEAVEKAVKALVTGRYRLSDGTVVEWTNNTAKGGGVFAKIDGKPVRRGQHFLTGRRIVEEGGKKMRATSKKAKTTKAVIVL